MTPEQFGALQADLRALGCRFNRQEAVLTRMDERMDGFDRRFAKEDGEREERERALKSNEQVRGRTHAFFREFIQPIATSAITALGFLFAGTHFGGGR